MTSHDGTGTARPSERAVIDAIPRGVVLLALDGSILLWNEAASRLFGWSEAEVLGRSAIDILIPAADGAEAKDALASAARGDVVQRERTVIDRDGRTVQIRTLSKPIPGPDGAPVAILSTIEDVAELHAAELRVRELLDHLRVALDAGGLGTWRWDSTTGETVWDDRLEAIFGLPAGGFDGTFEMWLALVHPDDRSKVLETLDHALESRQPYRVEHRVVWPDGSVHWIAGAGNVIVDERGNVTGTVGCSSDMTERMTQELERERLAALAVEAAERERMQRERLEFLAAINDVLNGATTIGEVMTGVTRRAVPRLGDWCSIHVVMRQGAAPEVEVAHVDPEMVAYARELQQRFPYDPNATTGLPHVIRTGETLFYPDITDELLAAADTTDEAREVVRQLALRSVIVVPLVKRGRVLGAMQFVRSNRARRYTEDDVALAQTMAGRIASSVENLRLQQQQRVIAQTLQRSLLPSSLPELPGIEVAVRYWAAGEASEVGGDFYDVFPLEPPQQWAVVIGDVCGTGPAAAALTALARHTIRDSAWHGDGPAKLLSALDRAVRRSASDSFLTAVYAVVDASGPSVELEVTCAGHPLPLLARADGVVQLGSPGSLLGVLPEPSFEPARTTLTSGDVLILFTDGATDVPPPHGLSEQDFCDLVARAVQGASDGEAVADRIRDELEAVQSFDDRDDDIALLVLRLL